MSYPSQFNAEKYQEIAGILQDLQELDPGARMTIRNLGESLTRTRSLLYEWLALTNLKPRFMIKVVLQDLIVIRRGVSPSATVEIEKAPIDVILAKWLRRAIMERDGKEYIERLKAEEMINQEEYERLLLEYDKVMR